jgi:hypothetical protein
VNAVGPGPIFTPFHQRRIAAAGETVEQYNAKAAQGTMLKRPGRAEEVAAAILLLASDDASYVTAARRCEEYSDGAHSPTSPSRIPTRNGRTEAYPVVYGRLSNVRICPKGDRCRKKPLPYLLLA